MLRPGGTLAATAFPAGPVEGDVFDELDRMHDRLGGSAATTPRRWCCGWPPKPGSSSPRRVDEPGRPVTPRSEADLIEARSPAWTWSIDDETWAGLVEPTLAGSGAALRGPRPPRPRPDRPHLPPPLHPPAPASSTAAAGPGRRPGPTALTSRRP